MILADILAAQGEQGWSTNLSASLTPYPREFEEGALSVGALVFGDLSYDYTDVPTDEQAGVYIITTMDTWYYRLHFSPAKIDFGNLSGDQQLQMYLWNAYFTPVDAESFDIVNGDGVTYSSDFPVPGDLAPLQQTEYTFYASADGPPTINATATWVIDGVTYEIPITGIRSVLFAFKPNWKTPVVEVYSWQTTLSKSFSGENEQAIRVRDIPRRAFEYSLRLTKNDVQLFDLLTFGWLGRYYVAPVWTESSVLTAPALLGDTTIYLDTRYRSFKPGGSVLLFKSPTKYELIQIESMDDTSLTLVDPVQQGLTGVKAYPAAPFLLDDNISTARQSSQHLDAAVRLRMNPVTGVLAIPDIAPLVTYLGYELYTKETNWRNALPLTIDGGMNVVDNGLGPIKPNPTRTFPTIVRGFKWLLKDRATANDLLGFFGRREGRFKPLWIPSGVDDMFLDAPVDASANSIYVQPIDYGNMVANHPARRHVVFIMRSGARIARRIESVEQVGTQSLVTLDAPVGVDLTPQNVKRISYLGFYRLGSDDVRFVWHTDTVAEVEVNFVMRKPVT